MTSRSHIERDRHARAAWYLIVAFGLAVLAYSVLGFDRAQALGYAVSCFIMLNLVNFKTMFGRLPKERVEQQHTAERE